MRAVRSRLRLWGAEGDAIIVDTERPWRLVLWEKAQYVPCWDLGGGSWFSTEWLETHSPESPQCWEPIMDLACRYSHAAIAESGPARATVQWDYLLCDNLYRVFRGNSRAEEYYHVYPDGLAVRHLVAWPGDQSHEGLNPTMWEVQEFILINGAGVDPREQVEPIGFTLTNLAGGTLELPYPSELDDWTSLCRLRPEIAEWSEYIGVVHLRGKPNPFVAFPRNHLLFPFENCTHCGKPHPQMLGFPRHQNYAHWPANDSADFVGWTVAKPQDYAKQATHTSFACCGYHYGGKTPPRPSSWLFLTGAVTQGVEEARRLAGSWLTPAGVETSGLFEGYAYRERAYHLRASKPGPLTVRLSPSRPIVNPVLRLYRGEAPAAVTWDGDRLGEDEVRTQTSGEDLLIWINRTLDRATAIEVTQG
jgi:hypothetical protein